MPQYMATGRRRVWTGEVPTWGKRHGAAGRSCRWQGGRRGRRNPVSQPAGGGGRTVVAIIGCGGEVHDGTVCLFVAQVPLQSLDEEKKLKHGRAVPSATDSRLPGTDRGRECSSMAAESTAKGVESHMIDAAIEKFGLTSTPSHHHRSRPTDRTA